MSESREALIRPTGLGVDFELINNILKIRMAVFIYRPTNSLPTKNSQVHANLQPPNSTAAILKELHARVSSLSTNHPEPATPTHLSLDSQHGLFKHV